MSAGDIVTGGGLDIAVWNIINTRGSSEDKRRAAREALRGAFPLERANSIEAVLRRAERSAEIGRRTNRNGPNYRPREEEIPDVRPLQRDSDSPIFGTPGNRPPKRYFGEVIIEIFDPRWPRDPIGSVGIVIPSESALTKSELENAAREAAKDFIDRLVASSPGRFTPTELSIRFRHGGMYIGY